MEPLDFIIIGGGINGLLIAYELNKAFPDKDLVLFEKEPFVGEHSSSRNSGVLHAGIYYPKESLKRKFCIEGNKLWRELENVFSLEINSCGKHIVACNPDQEEQIEFYFKKAKENGVKEISWVDSKELEKLQNYANISKAFFSKTTGLLNISSALKNIETFLYNKDVPLMLNNEVKSIEILKNPKKGERFKVVTEHEEVTTKFLINAAGPFAVNLRKQLGLLDLENYWVKGNYLKLSGDYYTDSLIYPVPLKNLKGLGVHTSFDFDGMVRFGPNTEEVNEISYGVSENVKKEMLPAIKSLFKGIDEEKLSLDYSGIRAKIKHNGLEYFDFWIKNNQLEGGGYIELCGMDSPGLTSAPAVARYVKKMVDLAIQK